MSLGSAARMSDLPALVAANENQTVPVSVLRGEARLDLQLHPKKWAGESLYKCTGSWKGQHSMMLIKVTLSTGRGLLGCHLLPV